MSDEVGRPWAAEPIPPGPKRRGRAVYEESVDPKGRYRVHLWRGHRFANRAGWQYRSRLVVSYAINAPLARDEHVHHLDGDIQNDVISNLEVVAASYHGQYHASILTLTGSRDRFGKFTSLDPGPGSVEVSAARLGPIISRRPIGVSS